MKRIKINEKQAKMLKDLSKTKILKITEEQYKAILQMEAYDSHPVSKEFKIGVLKSGSKGLKKDFGKIYEQFINELYNINEGEERTYEKLYKLMEVAGMIQDGRIVKEKFNNDKNRVKEVICAGLSEMDECGSPYRAMEAIEEALKLDDITPGYFSKQLGVKKTSDKSDEEREEALQALRQNELKRRKEAGEPEDIRDGKMEEDGGYPAGAEYDPRAPYNQKEPNVRKGEEVDGDFDIIYYNREIAIFKDANGNKYVFYYYDIDKDDFSPYADIEREFIGKDEDGDPMYDYDENWEVDEKAIENYLNDNIDGLKLGSGLDDYEMGSDFVKIDSELANDLVNTFEGNLSNVLADELNNMDEATGAASSGQFTGTFSAGQKFASNVTDELSEETISDIINKDVDVDELTETLLKVLLKSLKGVINSKSFSPDELLAKKEDILEILQDLVRIDDNKKPYGFKYLPNAFGKLLAYASDSSKGNEYAFKKYIKILGHIYDYLRQLDKDLFAEQSLEEVTSTTTAGNYQYDTPGFASSEFMGTKGKKGKAKVNKGITHKKTMLPGGKFVTIKDKCNKYPYCNQGPEAISINEVETGETRYVAEMDFYLYAGNDEEAKAIANTMAKEMDSKYDNKPRITGLFRQPFGSMDSTPVNEGMSLKEGLFLKHDKKNGLLAVFSDAKNAKEASGETYKSKNLLKKAGFQWNGNNWVIEDSRLADAKTALSSANKVEYMVDILEDLEEMVQDSNMDNKGLFNAKIEQYIIDLANATDERAVSAELQRYLTFFAKFHQYSFYNRILIFIQRPDAKKVASYNTWKERGRQVKKDSKAIQILVPTFPKGQNPGKQTSVDLSSMDLDDLEKAANTPRPTGFKTGNVFDISDTEAISPEGEIPETPQWFGDNEPSETADELFEIVKAVAENMGINVTQNDAKGGEKGYSAGDHINLTSDVAGAGRVSTMVHELAHELMHWKEKSMFYIGDEQRNDKALLELQAESVAYTVLTHYDIPVKHAATYIALWKGNRDKIMKNIKVISNVSQFIINEIDKMAKHMGMDNHKSKETNLDEIINEMINTLK